MRATADKLTFKVTIIGDGAIGKTSLISKFTQGNFQEQYITNSLIYYDPLKLKREKKGKPGLILSFINRTFRFFIHFFFNKFNIIFESVCYWIITQFKFF